MQPRFIAVFLAISLAAIAQTNNAALRGTVRDTTHAAIPGAEVVCRNVATGQVLTATTNQEGAYEFPFVPPSGYVLEVHQEGFESYSQQGVNLAAGEVKRQDIVLTVGSRAESVTVKADVSALQTETSQLSASIAPQRIESLPLLGRNLTTLITMQPAVTAMVTSTGLTFSMNGGPSGNGFNITLDGTDASAVSTQRVAVSRNFYQQTNTTSLEAVQEVRVYTNNYSADTGRATAGAMNVVTKSGTNDFHFGLFEYFRNSDLNANSTVANAAGLARAPIRLNQYGANAGGRIIRDRTFFWLGWENSNQHRAQTSQYNVLSAAGRAGIVNPDIRSYVDTWIPLPNQAPTAANPYVAQLIRNEIIDVRESIGTARIDHTISSKNTIFFRYNTLNAVTQLPDLYSPKVTGESNEEQQLFTLSDTHAFSPTLVNELRLGGNRFITPQVGGGPLPSITVTGGILASVGTTETYTNTAYNAVDSLFMQRGTHAIRVGVEWRQIDAGRKGQGNANFVYNNLTDFFNNVPAQLNIFQRYGGTVGTGGSTSAFIQDDWKVTPTLTLNLGMRYDLFFRPGERTGRAFNIISGIPPIQNLEFNNAGQPIFDHPTSNFGPRFGFAWTFMPHMVVRGGYGIFYAPQQASAGVTASANAAPPFVSNPDPNFIQPAATYTRSDAALAFPFTTYSAKYTPIAPTVFDPNYKDNYSQQYNLTVERELTAGMVLSAGYVGSKNTDVESARTLNLLRPKFGNTRENPSFTNITYIGPLAAANYQSLQVVLTRKFAKGLTIEGSYVWSHSLDDFSPYFGLNSSTAPWQDQDNSKPEHGESDFDVRHQVKSSFLYQLPYHSHSHLLNQVLGGWEVSGIYTARTGMPYTVMTGGSTGDGLNDQRANAVAGQSLTTGNARTLNAVILNRAAFAVPTVADPETGFKLGNLGKSVLAGPPSVNSNLALHRTFNLSERRALQFRGEFFNAFNQVNYSAPVSSLANPNFGKIISAADGRTVQLALKLNF
jgi:outer membrane receptor protein involved in Fe transport